jgi:DNA (cytosine-5)-methyltransferase 1
LSAAIPIADMCSGTGEFSAALQATILTPTVLTSLSDADSNSREYLQGRFPAAAIHADCRDQNIPDAAIVAIGAPCQDLSYAGRRAGAAAGSGTRSALIHDCVAAAINAHALLIAAENVPGGYSTYRAIADHLNRTGYRATIARGGAWEVGAVHRRQRIMLVATRRAWRLRPVSARRTTPSNGLIPTPTASAHTGPGRHGRAGGMNLQTWAAVTDSPPAPLLRAWRQVTHTPAPPHRDARGRLHPAFVEWLMGLPPAETLSRTARIRLAGNAVVARQAALMLARGLEQLDASN